MAVDSLGSRLTKRDILLIGDQSKIGIESTIIDCTRDIPIILRPGFITKQMIEGLLGISINSLEANIAVKFSGNFKSHYSPKAKVVIGGPYEFGAGFIAIRDIPTPPSLIRLSTPINNYEYAATLYESFAKADSLNLSSIHIIPATGNDLAIAINDRIKKASSEL
jgi:L-threonylcarbamoyladenylate synthase